jgi:hypothetical protein
MPSIACVFKKLSEATAQWYDAGAKGSVKPQASKSSKKEETSMDNPTP